LTADWRVSAARVEEIGGQTGHEMDDIGVVTDRRGYIFVQAKHRLQLSDGRDSALGEAVDQAVRQFMDGAPGDPDGSRRVLEPGRDALVILTDAAGSAPVRLHLKAVVVRFAGLPREKPLDDPAKNAPERSALKALLSRLRAAFARHDDGQVPTEDRLRAIGGLLDVIALDLDPGGSDRVNAESHLRGVLHDPATASGVWNDLVGQGLIESQRWANRDEARQALASGGHPAGIDPPFRNDVQRLREMTRAVLVANSDEVTIPAPEGIVAIQRDVAALATGTDGSFALIGEPGAGKSVLAATAADALLKAGEDVIFLRTESLAASRGATRVELGMQHNLDQVLAAWDGLRRGTLIIDGVDAGAGWRQVQHHPRRRRRTGTRDLRASVRQPRHEQPELLDPRRPGPARPGASPQEQRDRTRVRLRRAVRRRAVVGLLSGKDLPGRRPGSWWRGRTRRSTPRRPVLLRQAKDWPQIAEMPARVRTFRR
jgi:hypothetical protein